MDRGRGEIALKGKVGPGVEAVVEGEAFEALLLWEPRVGEAVTVVCGGGVLRRARVTGLEPDRAVLFVFEEAGRLPGLRAHVTLIQALPEKERMELIIQKATELGADEIAPVKTARSTSLTERESRQRKSHRWPDVALRAAKQSRRHTLPVIRPYGMLKEALETVRGFDARMLLWEAQGQESGPVHMRDLVRKEKERMEKEGRSEWRVAVLNGPEGGFTDDEVDEARKLGFTPVTLGPRILRTETAAILAVGVLGCEGG